MSSWQHTTDPKARLARAVAFLALALTVLGSVHPPVSSGLGDLALDGDIGCVDACGCPPNAAISACCCATESDESSGGGATLAVLVGDLGCTPPAPPATPASPVGPLLAERAEVILQTIVDPSLPGTLEARTPSGRSTRPPVPPPRG